METNPIDILFYFDRGKPYDVKGCSWLVIEDFDIAIRNKNSCEEWIYAFPKDLRKKNENK